MMCSGFVTSKIARVRLDVICRATMLRTMVYRGPLLLPVGGRQVAKQAKASRAAYGRLKSRCTRLDKCGRVAGLEIPPVSAADACGSDAELSEFLFEYRLLLTEADLGATEQPGTDAVTVRVRQVTQYRRRIARAQEERELVATELAMLKDFYSTRIRKAEAQLASMDLQWRDEPLPLMISLASSRTIAARVELVSWIEAQKSQLVRCKDVVFG